MKNIFRMLCAIAVVIGFGFSACGNNDDDKDDKSSPAKLSIKNETGDAIYVRIQNKTDVYTASPNTWITLTNNETKSWTIAGKGGSYAGNVDTIDLSIDNGDTIIDGPAGTGFWTPVDSSSEKKIKITKQGSNYKIEDL